MVCPNCGRAAVGKFCTNCGTNLSAAASAQQTNVPGNAQNQNLNYAPNQGYMNSGYAQGQNYNSGYAPNQAPNYYPNQSAYPGYVPNQGFNPGQQVVGGYQDISARAAGQAPGALLLRKHVRSPLVLIAAILVSLYAGITSFLGGESVLQTIDSIGDSFQYFDSSLKISYIVSLLGCAVQIILAVWMTASTWILFASADSVDGLKSCRAFVGFRMWVYTVLALASLVTLVVLIGKKQVDSDFLVAANQLTATSIVRCGLEALVNPEKIGTVGLVSIVLVFAVFRCSMLITACSSSIRMVRYGGLLQKRMLPAAVLTLLRSLVLLGGNIYMLAEYGAHIEWEGILFYVSFLVLGLASFLLSIVMFMNANGISRMRGQ